MEERPIASGREIHFGFGISTQNDVNQVPETTRKIEGLGYDFGWVPDDRLHRDCYVFMSLAAISSRRLRIGTMVTDPYVRHPAVTAAAMSTLNELSGGRMVLGIGAGGAKLRFMKVEQDRPVIAIRESVSVIRKLISGERFSFDGRVIGTKNAKQDFVVPHPLPIYIAARGPHILRAAGEIADGVIVGGLTSTKGLEYCMSELRKGAERVNRGLENFEFVSWVYTSISEDSKLAKEQVKPLICFLIMTSRASLREMGIDPVIGNRVLETLEREGITSPTSPNIRKATALLTDEIVDGCSLAGTPEGIIAKIRRMERIGTKQIAVLPFPLPGKDFGSVMTDFAEHVMPAFR